MCKAQVIFLEMSLNNKLSVEDITVKGKQVLIR